MKNSKANPKVEAYFKKATKWQGVMTELRRILLRCGLDEELKWGKPCYSVEGGNVVLIQGFKEYCALLFFKGVLLKNKHGVLVKTGPNTHVGRQIRFTEAEQVKELASVLKECVKEAIGVEKSGLKVPEGNTATKVPKEFKERLDNAPALKKAFEALTPGRQRGYLFHFSTAKQSKTREARIDKCAPQILKGKGFNE